MSADRRRALSAALQVHPDSLPRPDFSVDGDWLADFNAELERKAGVYLETMPNTWRPWNEGETWIACIQPQGSELGHALTMIGSRLLFDPNEHWRELPRMWHRFSLRIYRET
jgi:hypothetical protein